MKLSRSLLLWSTLALCGAMVLGAMTWLTRGVLASERDRVKADQERTTAENRADLEERTRLALWRMDALGAPIILREDRYPAGNYQAISPSELRTDREVLIRFHLEEENIARVQVPIILAQEVDLKVIQERDERVKRLNALLAAHSLPWDEWSRLNGSVERVSRASDTLPSDAAMRQIDNAIQRQSKSGQELRKDQTYQTNSNISEWGQRSKAVAQTIDSNVDQSVRNVRVTNLNRSMPGDPLPRDPWHGNTADVGRMLATWVGDELFLLRQVNWNTNDANNNEPVRRRSMQGVWLDSQELRKQLLHEVADLLPNAKLVPLEGRNAAAEPLAMVSFPFRLDRNEGISAPIISSKTPFDAALWVAWFAVLLALGMSSLLVHGVMRLSERRASFVSAVTHELRTPLTTFRLYSDMLESGAVKPEKRGDYLRVLSREADRLSHLVENVLSFSKIERGSARSVVRESTIADLLEPMRERLEARLATAGMTLEMDTACPLRVRVGAAAVEHILFNLIDNAAKYASAGNPPKVELRINSAGKHVEILVADYGPGIPASERRRIFRAFHKSAREAAESRPGVGLGLALSRRLAKSLGGGLECVDAERGACFVLRLPV